jgi:hypothetical protein
MAVEVSVGPQALTINHGLTFAVTDMHGEIASGSEQGMFSNDTRFVSSYGHGAHRRLRGQRARPGRG